MAFMTGGGGGGDFNTYVKYNAKAGRWYTKPSDSDGPEYEVSNMTAVFDFGRLQTGWFLFEAGKAPERNIDTVLGTPGPKPTEYHKRGFQMLVFSPANLGGVREFSSTAGTVIDAMNLLHDAYSAAPEAGQGKLPVVSCTGVNPVTSKHGTNYQPVFAITGWTAPPAELMEANLELSPQALVAAPAAARPAFQQATHVGPPSQNNNAVSAPPPAASGNFF